MGIKMIERNEVIQYLNKNISLAFEYESDFLLHFKRYFAFDQDELFSVYMASERVEVVYLDDSCSNIITTIPTNEFLDWCEELGK